MADLKVRIGAQVDRSVGAVFASMAEQARRARSQIEAELFKERETRRAAARQQLREEKEAIGARVALEKAAARDIAAQSKKAAQAQAQAEKEAARAVEQKLRADESWAKQRLSIQLNSAKQAYRIAEDEAKKEKKLRESDARNHAEATKKAGSAVAGAVLGVGGRAARFAANVAGDLARGIGVDTDIGSHFKNAADLETNAVTLSNSAFQNGAAGPAGIRQDPKDLIAQARTVGNATGFSANDILGAEADFTKKTGDLQTARGIVEELAQLSKATGTDMSDMSNAAAEVSNQLGDVPDKAEKVKAVMRQVAGAGKLGAVEISDLASQMAKVAASAQQIEGDPSRNIAVLGAFAQEAKLRGGAASASQAATSVQGMISTLKTPARAAAFKEKGINVFNEEGFIRDPQKILVEALQKTGRDPLAFKELYKNVSGGRAVEGFASIYRRTYADTQGSDQEKMAAATAAVNAEFDRLSKAAVNNEELQTSFAAAMNTSQAKAQLWNNEMDALAADTKDQLLPAFQSMVPVIRDELVPALKGAAAFIAWFGHSNADNTKAVTNSTSQARLALESGDPAALAAAQKQLGADLAVQGEDNLKTDTFTGSAMVAGKGFVKGFFGGDMDPNATPEQKADRMWKVIGGESAFEGAAKEYSQQKAQDDATLKTFNEGNKLLAEIRDAIKAQPTGDGGPPAGGAPPPTTSQLAVKQ